MASNANSNGWIWSAEYERHYRLVSDGQGTIASHSPVVLSVLTFARSYRIRMGEPDCGKLPSF